VPQHRGYEIGYRRRPEDMIAQIMRRLPGVAVALGFGISGCGGSARSTQTTAGSSPAETSMAAANYQGPLQNFQLADPANGPRVAADIAMVMENNLSASYPPAHGYFIFASCQKRGLPNELQCPWKVQNADQVEQVGDYAAAILATGIVYVYANNRGIYDVEVPAGGDACPVGATLPARTVSRPPPTATTPVPSSQATTRPQSTEQSIPHPAPSSPSTPPGAATTSTGSTCGRITTKIGPQSTGARDVPGTWTVAKTSVSCQEAEQVLTTYLNGGGVQHIGQSEADTYTIVDGWQCAGPRMLTAGCSRDRMSIGVYGPGASYP
jgi:hypothetical protein